MQNLTVFLGGCRKGSDPALNIFLQGTLRLQGVAVELDKNGYGDTVVSYNRGLNRYPLAAQFPKCFEFFIREMVPSLTLKETENYSRSLLLPCRSADNAIYYFTNIITIRIRQEFSSPEKYPHRIIEGLSGSGRRALYLCLSQSASLPWTLDSLQWLRSSCWPCYPLPPSLKFHSPTWDPTCCCCDLG